jgi:hypothetical protein
VMPDSKDWPDTEYYPETVERANASSCSLQ